jgi:hypothetical protein
MFISGLETMDYPSLKGLEESVCRNRPIDRRGNMIRMDILSIEIMF